MTGPGVSSSRPWYLFLLLAAGVLGFGVSAVLIRLVDDAPVLAVAAWRTLLAALMLAPVALVRARGDLRRLTGRTLAWIGAAGVLFGLHFIAWIAAVYHTSIASATVLVATSPIFLAVLGYAFLQERLSARLVVGIVLAAVGTGIMAWGDATGERADSLLGNGLALLSALLHSFYLLIGRVQRQHLSWLAYVFPLYTVAALTVLPIAWWAQVPLTGYPPVFFMLCALMALLPQIVGHGAFNYAVKYFPVALLGLAGLLEPVLASTLALLLFGEVPGHLALAGMGLVLLSVVFALRR
jgi:drug/metabolite transporter (DMT)-like permease